MNQRAPQRIASKTKWSKIKLIALRKRGKILPDSKYIVQYVGFETSFSEHEFVPRWKPTADRFKSLGIISIDLYKNIDGEKLKFLSRNTWDSAEYLKNFSSGVAGSGGGGGISVIQFGGYWMIQNQLPRPEELTLLFMKKIDSVSSENQVLVNCQVTKNVPYQQTLELPSSTEYCKTVPSLKLNLKYILTI